MEERNGPPSDDLTSSALLTNTTQETSLIDASQLITDVDIGNGQTERRLLSGLEFSSSSSSAILSSTLPGVVVISSDDINSNSDGNSEPLAKGMFFETVNADGHTYVLTLHDESGIFHATPIRIDETPSLVRDGVVQNEGVSDVSQAWFTSREDKTNLQSKGHIWKQGMWSKEEIELLEHNIGKYCMENNVVDPAAVIFEMTKDERKDFYRQVAKGLNRPLFSVYRRVIRMYDNKNHIGKYSGDEMKKLKELRVKHGNNWHAIGIEMGRSASSIKDKCRLMKDNCNSGKWFPCEEDRLAESVYELSGAVPGEMVTTGISWASVADRVGTRSEKQCRTKWLNYLNWKQVGGSEWTREDDVTLITRVCSLGVSDENDVDWIKLGEGWDSVRSPQWLRGKWWSLKRHIPNNHTVSFKDICAQLFANHVSNVDLKNDTIVSMENGIDSQELHEAIVPVTSVTTVTTLPSVGMVPASNIVHMPLQVKHDGIELTATGAILKDDHSLQTYELLQSGVHLTATSNPGAFFISPSPTTTIPITKCTPTSTGQIIIQTLTNDALQSASNVTMQMNMPSQIIISTNSDGSNVATFAAPNLSGPIHLTSVVDHKDELHCFAQETTLISNSELNGEIGHDSVMCDNEGKSNLQSHLSMGMNPFDPQVKLVLKCKQSSNSDYTIYKAQNEEKLECVLETGKDVDDSELSVGHNHMDLEQNDTEITQHLISDPLLQGETNSPDNIMGTSSDDLDKTHENDDSLDDMVEDDT